MLVLRDLRRGVGEESVRLDRLSSYVLLSYFIFSYF